MGQDGTLVGTIISTLVGQDVVYGAEGSGAKWVMNIPTITWTMFNSNNRKLGM